MHLAMDSPPHTTLMDTYHTIDIPEHNNFDHPNRYANDTKKMILNSAWRLWY